MKSLKNAVCGECGISLSNDAPCSACGSSARCFSEFVHAGATTRTSIGLTLGKRPVQAEEDRRSEFKRLGIGKYHEIYTEPKKFLLASPRSPSGELAGRTMNPKKSTQHSRAPLFRTADPIRLKQAVKRNMIASRLWKFEPRPLGKLTGIGIARTPIRFHW
jgi:hypothetical protein